MKTIILTMALAVMSMMMGMSPASAHCGKCGEGHAKAGEMKPCETTLGDKKPCKCMESGKKCGCASKTKMEHDHGKKPCKVCQESEKSSSTTSSSPKGSLKMMSRGAGANSYN